VSVFVEVVVAVLAESQFAAGKALVEGAALPIQRIRDRQSPSSTLTFTC
jgi:hypothetical protein